MTEDNLSGKVLEYDGGSQSFKYFNIETIQQAVKRLKEKFWTPNEKEIIDKIFGKELVE